MLYVIFSLFLFIILFIMPLKINIYYEFTDESKYKIIITYLFGLIKKEIDSTKKEETKYKNRKIKFKINPKDYIHYMIHKGNVKKIHFKMNIGFKDPNLLGISIGIIWAIVNGCFAYIFRNKNIDKIKEKNIQVNPIFNEDVFEMFFLCIINVKLVYIIIAYIRILKERKEGGDSVARTSNRRLNENYNE